LFNLRLGVWHWIDHGGHVSLLCVLGQHVNSSRKVISALIPYVIGETWPDPVFSVEGPHA
jgi:Co/Zn/Cd efflux system component